MNRTSIRLLAAAAVCCLAVTVVSARQGGGGQQAPAPPAGPFAPEKYKDIQVLKDVPASQLDVTMRYFVAATGLTCDRCHMRDQPTGELAYDKDTRGKTTARSMIKLVQTVNAGDYGAKINCGTCHQGRNQPAGLTLAQMMTPDQIAQFQAQQAAAAARQGGAGAPPAGGGAPGAGRGAQTPVTPMDDVLTKYQDAMGGASAIAAIKSFVVTGTVTARTMQSMAFTLERKGDKFRETVQTQPTPITRGFDGSAGWFQAGTNIADVTGFPLQQAVRYADLMLPADLKTKYPNLQSMRAGALPAATPGTPGTPVSAVRGTNTATGISETFYFDTTSGLLLRRTVTTSTALNGRLTEQFDYAEYRAVNGVKMPYEIKRTNWNTLDTLKVSDIKANTNLDDARFAKPK